MRLAARDRLTIQQSTTGLEPVAGRSVLSPVIRYIALAFIVFQVATTAALATQVVLFESDTDGSPTLQFQ